MLTALGIGIVAGSYGDISQNDVLIQTNQSVRQLRAGLEQDYHIHRECISSGTAFGGPYCGLVFSRNYSFEERTRMLKEFNQKSSEIDEAEKKIYESIDQEVFKEATRRSLRDFAGLLFGSAMSMVGLVEFLRNVKRR